MHTQFVCLPHSPRTAAVCCLACAILVLFFLLLLSRYLPLLCSSSNSNSFISLAHRVLFFVFFVVVHTKRIIIRAIKKKNVLEIGIGRLFPPVPEEHTHTGRNTQTQEEEGSIYSQFVRLDNLRAQHPSASRSHTHLCCAGSSASSCSCSPTAPGCRRRRMRHHQTSRRPPVSISRRPTTSTTTIITSSRILGTPGNGKERRRNRNGIASASRRPASATLRSLQKRPPSDGWRKAEEERELEQDQILWPRKKW